MGLCIKVNHLCIFTSPHLLVFCLKVDSGSIYDKPYYIHHTEVACEHPVFHHTDNRSKNGIPYLDLPCSACTRGHSSLSKQIRESQVLEMIPHLYTCQQGEGQFVCGELMWYKYCGSRKFPTSKKSLT